MLRRFPLIALFCLLLAGSAAAQDGRLYRNAVGGRIEFGYGSWVGLSWKHMYTKHHGTELAVLFANLVTVIDAEYHFNGRFNPAKPNFQYVLGVSGALAMYKFYDTRSELFLRPVIGLETKLKGTPINIGVDWRPMFGVSGNASNTATRFSIPIRLAF